MCSVDFSIRCSNESIRKYILSKSIALKMSYKQRVVHIEIVNIVEINANYTRIQKS